MKEKQNKFLESLAAFFFQIFTFGKYRKLDRVKTEYEEILDAVSSYVGNLSDTILAMYYYDQLNNMINQESFTSYHQMIDMYEKRIIFLEENFKDVPLIKTRLRDKTIDSLMD